jgi:superfamily II DNA helicase RecQ
VQGRYSLDTSFYWVRITHHNFRPDYVGLGVLCGRFPKNIPFVVASATLPSHVLNDVRHKLQLGTNTKMVQLTNARPNVALSVRTMKHSEETKGSICFLIPPNAKKPKDIPITLVYCNQRTTTEDAADRARDWAIEQGITPDCIAFYHTYVGEKRKCELESLLKKGEIHILFCTDAVGMVCFHSITTEIAF